MDNLDNSIDQIMTEDENDSFWNVKEILPTDEDGIFAIENGKLLKCFRDDLTTVEIPEGIVEIEWRVFYYFEKLESVKFEKTE